MASRGRKYKVYIEPYYPRLTSTAKCRVLTACRLLPTTYPLLTDYSPSAAYHKVYKKPGRADAKSLPDAWRRQREIEAEAGAEVLGVAAELLTALAPGPT